MLCFTWLALAWHGLNPTPVSQTSLGPTLQPDSLACHSPLLGRTWDSKSIRCNLLSPHQGDPAAKSFFLRDRPPTPIQPPQLHHMQKQHTAASAPLLLPRMSDHCLYTLPNPSSTSPTFPRSQPPPATTTSLPVSPMPPSPFARIKNVRRESSLPICRDGPRLYCPGCVDHLPGYTVDHTSAIHGQRCPICPESILQAATMHTTLTWALDRWATSIAKSTQDTLCHLTTMHATMTGYTTGKIKTPKHKTKHRMLF